MTALLLALALLAPTPRDADPAAALVGTWEAAGPTWPGWTLTFAPDGSYLATCEGQPNAVYAGEWSYSRGYLTVRERLLGWDHEDGPRFGPWCRYEWYGPKVEGGRIVLPPPRP